jgi:hypothetical protein
VNGGPTARLGDSHVLFPLLLMIVMPESLLMATLYTI